MMAAMELSAQTLTLIAITTFLAATVGGMGGFGTGIMLTAVLTPILGIKAVVPILAVAGIIINMGRFWFYRHDFDVRIVKIVLPSALVCLVAGTFLYKVLPPGPLSVAIGLVVLASIPARRVLAKRNLHIGAVGLGIGGGVFGFLNGMASGMGIVLVSLLLGAGLAGTAVLATDSLITIAVDIVRALIFGKFDLLSANGLLLGGFIGLVSLPGSWVASMLVKRLGARLHIVVIEVLILAGGLSLVVHGVRAS